MRPFPALAGLLAALLTLSAGSPTAGRRAPTTGYRSWSVYGGGPDSIRYSALSQINRGNVAKLQTAWTYDTGDAFAGSEMQCNPIVVDGALYAASPKGRVVALDAATGKERWTFDPNTAGARTGKTRLRGFAYWADGDDHRLLFSVREHLHAIDAVTGRPIPGFGENGRVDLRVGLGRDPQTLTVSSTTPGVVYRDLLILGSIVPEDLPSAPGDIRAFDIRTGSVRWTFHTIPRAGEFGYDTWPKDAWQYTGGANSWAGLSLDAGRGLVFVPTGSASADFYGANRAGDNLFANCLIALKADTGERVWHVQTVRHDLWDRDLPAPPSLVTVRRGGKLIDAVAQVTKSGHTWVLDRERGTPLFPVEERPVPATDVAGEWTAKTQPGPTLPPPFSRQRFTPEMVTRRTPEAHAVALARLRGLRSNGQFEPPSLAGTVIFPGFDGGGEWGGQAFDPETGLFYVNANEMAWVLRLVERQPAPSGKALYAANCASCHGADRRGQPPEFPAVVDLETKHNSQSLTEIIRKGAGRMPGFSHLPAPAVRAITRYVLAGEDLAVDTRVTSLPGRKYTHDGYNKFLDPDGYPAVEPPWGTLNAINLDTGRIAWSVPFGEFPELVAKGLRNTGSENYGGPVVTAGGLLFIGATNHDRQFRAFDKQTGKVLWQTTLPAGGNATPAVYEAGGRQFVVIAAGGGKSGRPSGGSYVAFALPASAR